MLTFSVGDEMWFRLCFNAQTTPPDNLNQFPSVISMPSEVAVPPLNRTLPAGIVRVVGAAPGNTPAKAIQRFGGIKPFSRFVGRSRRGE